jgi:manganese/zinc/iron transport system permease protein
VVAVIDYNTLIVLVGVSLLGASAGLVGTFAVLRRRALTGDALSHAALPGICLAFLLTGGRGLPVLLAGALLSGLLGVLVITALRRHTRLKEDAAIGIVLSVFFGAGIVLLTLIQRNHVSGNKAGLNSFILGKTAGMIRADVYLIAGAALFCLLVILALYKELKLVSFDGGFARVQGWPGGLLDLLLMTLLAVTVMIGLPAVGAVLMAALVILPAATARLWTQRLSTLLLLAAIIGACTGAVGAMLSASLEKVPAGPIIILVGTCFFLLSLALSPRHGLVSHLLASRRFRRELERRTLLRVLYEMSEASLPDRPAFSPGAITGRRSWRLPRVLKLLSDATRMGYVENTPAGGHVLTEQGLSRAAEVVRGQRLWALFLTEYPDLASGVANLAEESIDRLLPPALVAELEQKVGLIRGGRKQGTRIQALSSGQGETPPESVSSRGPVRDSPSNLQSTGKGIQPDPTASR